MNTYYLTTPIDKNELENIKTGDMLYISGRIYTARDSAHKRLVELLLKGESLPFQLKGSVIYYAGPAPTKPGHIIGSVGPTTSYRMDAYTPKLLEEGVAITIGKGKRSPEVVASIKENKALYCAAYGGAGALMASKVLEAKAIAFEELGPEAIYQLTVENFPVTVINDGMGRDLYQSVNERG